MCPSDGSIEAPLADLLEPRDWPVNVVRVGRVDEFEIERFADLSGEFEIYGPTPGPQHEASKNLVHVVPRLKPRVKVSRRKQHGVFL